MRKKAKTSSSTRNDESFKLNNSEIIKFLSSQTSNASFIDSLKIKYRPYVCPFNELISYAQKEQSIFDIGCGSGQFLSLLAQYTKVSKLRGIEIDSGLIANARQINKDFKNKEISFRIFNGIKIPDEIKEYDLIYMIDVYHHIPVKIREDFIKQVFLKMRPGSKLLFKDIDAASPFLPFNKLHDLVFAKEYSHEISFSKAVKLIESLGFEIKEARTKQVLLYPHYFILAKKPSEI